MAFKLNYTDQYGVNYPESYWKPIEISINVTNYSILIRFGGFIDTAKANGRIIGERSYGLNGAEFGQMINSPVIDGGSIKTAVLSKAYQIALDKKDIKVGEVVVNEGLEDEHTDGVYESFFEQAETI